MSVDDQRHRATIGVGGGDDDVGEVGIGDEVRDPAHAPAVIVGDGPAATASRRPRRAGSTTRWCRAPFRPPTQATTRRAPASEPVDSQCRMHRAVNDRGTQRAAGLDAEDSEIGQASAGAAVLFVDRQAEHARVGQRLPQSAVTAPARPRASVVGHSAASRLRHIAARSRSS